IIAPILTMFFLTTYGVLNAAAGIEGLLDSPSFRPSFKIHWIFSLLGTVGCIVVMFLINGLATGVAFIFIAIIFLWLQSREMKTAWGDVRRGVWMALVRLGLFNLSTEKASKTWRPNPLVLSGAPTKRWHLIEFASSITHNRGILTVATVLTSNLTTFERRKQMQQNIEDFLTKRSSRGFARVIEADDTFKGAEDFVKAYGLASLEPNTIIVGDTKNPEHRTKYCEMITNIYKLNRNLVIVRDNKDKGFGKRENIDIWWGGLKGNGGLLMILSYLLKTSRSWYGAKVTLKILVDNHKAEADVRRNLSLVIKKLRTGAKLEVIVSNKRSFFEILKESSAKADLIFMGLARPDSNFESYYANLQEQLSDLPTTILVMAAEEISFGEVLMQQDTFRKN
ncbi:MAG: Na-K-Cl cotransporter, partial [Christiangramia sp.]